MLNAAKLSAVIVATGIALHAGGPRASAQTSNVVIQWNQTLQAQFVGTGPGIHIRALPMMHIAMFDAINSIEERYTPYLGQVKGSHGASAEAAAAAAARDVLAALYPTQQAVFDNLLASQLAGIPRRTRATRSGNRAGSCQGGSRLAEERRLADHSGGCHGSGPDIRASPVPGVMAADTAGEQLCDVYVLSTRASIRDVDEHSIPAASTANTHEHALRHRLQ